MKTKTMTPDEKRSIIKRFCDRYEVEPINGTTHCIGCPLDGDPDAWCKHGFVRDIKTEDLDKIIQAFQSSKESAGNGTT